MTTSGRGAALSVAFTRLSSCFHHVFLLPARFVLCCPTSLSHTSSPLTLTEWSHSSCASATKYSCMIKFLSGSYPQRFDVTVLILHGVNMSWLSAFLCDSGKLAIFSMFQSRKTTLIRVKVQSNEFQFLETSVQNKFWPSCKFPENPELRSTSAGQHSLWGGWQHRPIAPGSLTCSPILSDLCNL